MTPFRFARGSTPLLISVPHPATFVPDEIAARMTDAGRAVADTDWHVDRLYEFARALGANLLIATHSRYVVDLNRSPDGVPLYDDASNTEICPGTSFAHEPIYRPGAALDDAEIGQRIATYWRPYHDTIRSVLDRLVASHGVAVLLDAHSVASRVPRFFEGRIQDINLGTAGGAACDPDLAAGLLALAERSGYSAVLDGRFRGGYITRHYGRPAERIHAIQLELSWATYLDEAAPSVWDKGRAQHVMDRALQPITEALLQWARASQVA